jgi:hypothetical protein
MFVMDLLGTVEFAGAVTFYGRGLAQQHRARVRVQISYLGGETPTVMDSFEVSDTVTTVQGRVAVGPPGRQVYQKAIEKLIRRLRDSSYFR